MNYALYITNILNDSCETVVNEWEIEKMIIIWINIWMKVHIVQFPPDIASWSERAKSIQLSCTAAAAEIIYNS